MGLSHRTASQPWIRASVLLSEKWLCRRNLPAYPQGLAGISRRAREDELCRQRCCSDQAQFSPIAVSASTFSGSENLTARMADPSAM